MANFKNLLKPKKNGAETLRTQIEADRKKNNSYDDDRKWRYSLDKAGNAFAIIRFLPASPKDCDWYAEHKPEIDQSKSVLPFTVSRQEHGFKQNGNWFGGVCPTTWGEDCPVCEYNSAQIAETGLGFKELPEKHPTRLAVSNRKRNEKFFANILVVSDPKNPDNNGKVFLFEFGYTINEYIMAKICPNPDYNEPAQDISDLITGSNFKLKVYKHSGKVKYDRSEWEPASPVSEDESELEKIWNSEYPLFEFVDDSAKESYENLQKKLVRVVGSGAAQNAPKNPAPEKDQESNPNEVLPDVPDDDDDKAFLESLL